MRRRLLTAVIAITGLLAAGVAGALMVLNSQAGQKMLAAKIAQSLSTPDRRVEITGVSGLDISDIRVASVSVSDAAGVWLSVADLSVSWRPLSLLGGQVHVTRLSVGELVFERLSSAPSEAAAGPPGLPKLPLALMIDDMQLPNVILGQAVVGERMRLGLSGHMASDAVAGISSALRLEALEGPGTTLVLDATADPRRNTLAVSLNANEPEGGLVGRLLGVADSPAMRLSLSGDGPLPAWPGTFEFVLGKSAAEPDVRIAGSLSADLQSAMSVRLSGQADAAQTYLPQRAALGAGPFEFDLRAHLDVDAWSANVDAFSIGTTAWRINATGLVELENLSFDGRVEGVVSQTVSWGEGFAIDAGHAAAKVSGFAAAPELEIQGALQAPRGAGLSARALDFTAHLAAPEAGKGAPFEIRATLDAPQTATAAVDALLALGVQIDAHGFVLGDTSHVALDGLAVATRNLSLRGEGWLDYAGLNGQMTVNGEVPDLAGLPIADLAGMQGRASVDAEVRGGPDNIHAEWRVKVEHPATGIAALDPWLGAGLEGSGVLSSADGDAWTVDALRVQSDAMALEGTARLIASTGRVDGRFSGISETLSPLGATADMPIEGRAQFQGAVSGALADPDVKFSLKATGPRFGPVQGELAEVDIQARTVASAPAGQTTLRFVSSGEEVVVKSAFALRLGQDLRLDHIRVQAAGGTGAGALVWALPSGGLSGTVNVAGVGLGPLGRMAGVDVAGTVSGSMALDHDQGRQRVNAEINAEPFTLAQPDLRIQKLVLRATGRQEAETLTFDAHAQLSRIRTSSVNMDVADIHIQGTPARAEVTLTAHGPKDEIETLSVKSLIGHDGDVWTADLSAFEGRIGSTPIALRAPTRLSYAPAQTSLSCLHFSVAEGSADACLDFTPQRVDGSMTLADLPVSVFAPWLPAQSDWAIGLQGGLVGADLKLQGSPQSPDLDFKAAVKDVRLSGDGSPSDRVSLNASGAFSHGVLTASADLSGPAETRGQVQVRLPGRLSLSPFLAEIDERDSFEAALRLDGTLDGVQRFLPLDPHRILGDVTAQLSASGTLSQPQWSGTALLQNGRYENIKTGSVLKDLALDLQGSGDKLVLRSLRASDGDKGMLVGHGEIQIVGANHAILNIDLALKELQVVRRDDVTAIASGDLSVTGAAETPHIAGALTLSPVEIRLPDTLPAEVVELPVTDVVGAAPTAPQNLSRQDRAQAAPVAGPSLDLSVDVPGRMFLRGKGLTSEWAGQLRVLRRDALVQVEGALRPVRGEYQFAGKAFRLAEGSVVFTSGDDPVPTLDLAAEYTRGDFKAIVRIEGSANTPRITLASIPELPQDEILARILFGRSTGQLSPLEAAQLASAVTQLSGSRSFDGGGLETLRKAIGTDVLRFEGGEGGQGPSATAGKYVTDQIYVGVQQGTTPKSSGATVEVELTPHISLDSQVRQDSSTHLGVKWKWDY